MQFLRRNARKIIAGYFVLLFLIYAWIAFDFTAKLRIWSPIDEIAQYDYIDKLSSGHIPSPTEPISDNTANLSINYFDWIKAPDFKGTKETMGLAGLSYEAWQPPIYYLVMAAPNLIVKSMSISPWMKIKVLREIGVLAQISAAIIIGVSISKCRRFAKIDPIWSLIIPVLVLIPGWDWRGPINNSNFALLTVALSCLFLLMYLENQDRLWTGGLSVLFATLSFLTKYTYGLLLVLVVGICLVILWQNRNRASPWTFVGKSLLLLSPTLLIILYLLFNAYRFGLTDIFGSKAVTSMFAAMMTINRWGLGLIKFLIVTAFSIPYLNVQPPWVAIFVAGCCLTLLLVIWLFIRGKIRESSIYVVCLGTVAVIIALVWLLSKVNPYVDWDFFRHFFGFLGFFLVAAFGFAFRPGIVQKVMTGLLMIALAFPAIMYFISLG